MSLCVDIEKTTCGFHLASKFEADRGVTGILGASGSGKSMTLKCIAGIIKPDRGRIVLDGDVLFDSKTGIDLPPQKRHVGLLFQNYALFPNMTVEENLLTGLRASEKNRKKAREQAAEMMEKFYLTGLEKLRPGQLSGGQQQRTALARILLTRPRLLMLDEPFSALDGYLRWNLEMELTDILKEFGVPALFVSHSRDEIYRICQKACVMEHGRSTPVLPVKTMFQEPGTLAACMLSGCKNYSSAKPRPEGGRQIWAGDWGVTLDCGRAVPENITHVGVRSHYIRLLTAGQEGGGMNVMECRITRIVEDVFNMVVMAAPVGADECSDNGQLRLEMPKDQWTAYTREERGDVGQMIRVGIRPEDVLLLVCASYYMGIAAKEKWIKKSS